MKEERDRAEEREALVDRESGGRFMQKARSVLYVPSLIAFALFTLVCAPWQVLVVFVPIALLFYAVDRALQRAEDEYDDEDAL